MRTVVNRGLMWSLWPSFLISAIASLLIFTLLDPREIAIFGHDVSEDRMAFYTVAFFILWLVTAASSWLTFYLASSSNKKLVDEDWE